MVKETMIHRNALLPILAAVLFASSACSDTENGSAEVTQAQSTASSETTTSSGGQSTTPISRSIDPCTLINPEADLAKYGTFKEPKRKTRAGARSCTWQRNKTSPLDDELVLSLDIRDSQTVDAMEDVGGGVNTGEINGRMVAESPDPKYQECTLGLKLDNRSRIDVGVSAVDDVDRACSFAREIGYLIEPRLPTVGA